MADRYLPYADIVDEALCFGWIDSLPRNLDARRTMHLLSPRKPKSAWSKRNKARVQVLRSQGRMQPSGEAVIERAKQDGSWSKLDSVEKLTVPKDLRAALNRQPEARAYFVAFPPSSRRLILEWISQAKRPETRAKRIQVTIAKAAVGQRANHYRQTKIRKSLTPA